MTKLSGLQSDVLKLYRRCLRSIRTKPPDAQDRFRLYLQYQFRHPSRGGGVSKRDVTTIEYLLREGRKTVELWESGTVKNAWVTRDMSEWAAKERPGLNKKRADS
ncbi:hypothetical protein FRB94_007755 [Tulasnella sp. JGI-2019a]|nr:hypothetical protein FRB93_011148 [Tulasnella sp. JGI-2019a]KAG9011765.1 hypothetical protein FRB94_007755 [Tulasnella sp. JGI-2019a]KAG9036987.1 hypothetical protein FRB95_007282 [Tulasnella sp. JGI-2019a]